MRHKDEAVKQTVILKAAGEKKTGTIFLRPHFILVPV